MYDYESPDFDDEQGSEPVNPLLTDFITDLTDCLFHALKNGVSTFNAYRATQHVFEPEVIMLAKLILAFGGTPKGRGKGKEAYVPDTLNDMRPEPAAPPAKYDGPEFSDEVPF